MTIRPSLDRLHAALDALQDNANPRQYVHLAAARQALAEIEQQIVASKLKQENDA